MTAEPDLLPLPWIERYSVVGDIAYPVSSDPDGDYVAHDDHTAAMQAYARANVAHATSPLQAEVEALRAEVDRLKSMTAVTMGVGRGDGNLFVHGDYDSIKAAQALVFRAERMAEALREMREYVTAALQDQREAFAGHEDSSDIPGIEADLHKIDTLLRAQENDDA